MLADTCRNGASYRQNNSKRGKLGPNSGQNGTNGHHGSGKQFGMRNQGKGVGGTRCIPIYPIPCSWTHWHNPTTVWVGILFSGHSDLVHPATSPSRLEARGQVGLGLLLIQCGRRRAGGRNQRSCQLSCTWFYNWPLDATLHRVLLTAAMVDTRDQNGPFGSDDVFVVLVGGSRR